MSFSFGQFVYRLVMAVKWLCNLALCRAVSLCQHGSLVSMLGLGVILLSAHSLSVGDLRSDEQLLKELCDQALSRVNLMVMGCLNKHTCINCHCLYQSHCHAFINLERLLDVPHCRS